MKNSPKYSPLFLALSLTLSAIPQAAFAQLARPIIAPVAGAASAGSAAGAAVNGISTIQSFSPLTTSAPAPLAAAAIAPTAALPAAMTFAAPTAALAIRTPGAAATGVADEAAEYANAPANAAAPKVAGQNKGLIRRLADVVMGRSGAATLFDFSGIKDVLAAVPASGQISLRPQKPLPLPNGTNADEQPTNPTPDRSPSVRLQTYAIPGSRDVGTIEESSRRVLSADPANVGAVVDAVKALVDSDRTRYGVPSSELRLIGARKFEGHGDQADSIFIHFRQIKSGLVINNADLSFTIKVIGGKATVVAQNGQLFPQIDVDTESTMTDEQIKGKIAERTGIPTSEVSDSFQFSEEKIIYSRGSWRHVKLYVAEGLPFMVAVDLSTGLVFAWDNRTGLESFRKKKAETPSTTGSAAGTVSGRTVDHGPILPTAAIKDIPLGYLNVTIGGKTYTTDKDGKFSADGLTIPAAGLTVTATLSGPYVNVQDTSGQTLTINVTLKPGDGAIKAVFNPDATLNDENALAQVSAFHKVNLAYNFLRARKLTTEQMDKNPIVVRTNIDDECNAYYTPGTPSLNFFKSSANCVNSAYDTVADHEYGHYWDDSTGGIMNGGLSEGWGDTLSMYLLNNPVIGEHFMKNPGPDGKDYIREGNNTYQYNEFDEVHAQGQAWQGFTWKLRKALMQQLGDAAGAAMAEALVLPTMFAKAKTIPDAMTQVLVSAMKKDGTIQFEKLIRDTAKIHGITLAGGKSLVERLVDRFTMPLNGIKGFTATVEGGAAAPEGAQIQAATNAVPTPEARATLTFSVGALSRKQVSGEIVRYLDKIGSQASYTIVENKSLLSTDYKLVISGPKDQVQAHADNISRWIKDQSASVAIEQDAKTAAPQAAAAAESKISGPKTHSAGKIAASVGVGAVGAVLGLAAAHFMSASLSLLAVVPGAVNLIKAILTKIFGPRAWVPAASLAIGVIGGGTLAAIILTTFSASAAAAAFAIPGIFSALAIRKLVAAAFKR